MRRVLSIAIAAGFAGKALPALAASGEAASRMPCRPPLSFAHADAHSAPTGDEPRAMLLLAVDRRINGCRVLTPANAHNGWVPEPTDAQDPARKRPTKPG